MAKPFEIVGIRVAPGTSKPIRIKVSETFASVPVFVPITVIHGSRPGPVLFVTAAVHGDELNGIEVVREIAAGVHARDLSGTLLLVHVVNVMGFQALSRYLPDGQDLNRAFPGSRAGNLAANVAHAVFAKIITHSDYGIDLHTAARGRDNMPHLRADLRRAGIRKLAGLFGAEVLFDGPGHPYSLRTAAGRAGIPTVVFEAGESLRFQKDHIAAGVTGVRNVLIGLGMITGSPIRPLTSIVARRHAWVRARRGGILILETHPGELVRKGDVLAVSSKPYGKTVNRITAPFDGLVVGTTTLPMASPGTPVAHLIRLGPARLRELRRGRYGERRRG